MLKKIAPALVLLASLALAQKSAAPAAVKVGDLVKGAAKLDGKRVTVVGTVSAFKAKTSKGGKPYLMFDLTDHGATVKVFSHGKLSPEPKNGAKVRVTGMFAAVKKLRNFEIKNEIDASPKMGEKGGKPAIVPVK